MPGPSRFTLPTKEVFILDPKDNVATLVSDCGKQGTTFRLEVGGIEQEFTLAGDIPFGHKFAIRPIPQGAPVIKYGFSIGAATVDIRPGEHVHVHNLESNRGRGDLAARAQEVSP